MSDYAVPLLADGSVDWDQIHRDMGRPEDYPLHGQPCPICGSELYYGSPKAEAFVQAILKLAGRSPDGGPAEAAVSRMPLLPVNGKGERLTREEMEALAERLKTL